MNPSDSICTAEDDFTEEQRLNQARWMVELSDGRTVIQDDNRPGCEPASAWIRLGNYCRTHNVRIAKMWLQFRSNTIQDILPANADGYYFCKSALGMLCTSTTMQFMLIGHLTHASNDASMLVVQRWKVPELLFIEQEPRDPSKAGECLIEQPQLAGRSA